MGLYPTASDRATSDHPTESIFAQGHWGEWPSSNPVDLGLVATMSATPAALLAASDHRTAHHVGLCRRQSTATVPLVYFLAGSVCQLGALHLL